MLCAGTAVFLFMNSAFSAALFSIDNTTSDNKSTAVPCVACDRSIADPDHCTLSKTDLLECCVLCAKQAVFLFMNSAFSAALFSIEIWQHPYMYIPSCRRDGCGCWLVAIAASLENGWYIECTCMYYPVVYPLSTTPRLPKKSRRG